MPTVDKTVRSSTVKTIIEPFRVKMVEPIRMSTRQERERIAKEKHYNLFAIRSEDVLIDLLTDSGTNAMSAAQWGAMIQGDEAYACARSFYRFEDVIRDLTGYRFILPTHQGRAAERILFTVVGKPGLVIPNNSHFDTTRANIEHVGAVALDLPCPESHTLSSDAPFKGNMDLERLRHVLDEYGKERVPLVMVTVTNNSGGGQPVSLENLRKVCEISHSYGIPVYLDAARFAENAYFIKLRDPGQQGRETREIAKEMFRLTDGCTMSAKKDGLVNIGGFIATNDEEVGIKMRNFLILTEGFTTYGGLAGRDLEAIARGLEEVLDEDYLRYRIASTAYLGDRLHALGIPVLRPIGGHAVYLDGRGFLPHIPPLHYPGQALSVAIYIAGGIRSVETGQVMFSKHDAQGQELVAEHDLVRMAIPRRVYTQSHIDYVLEVMEEVWHDREKIRGLRIAWQPDVLRHFTARYEQI
jgi:tyrosine phenol-lyase